MITMNLLLATFLDQRGYFLFSLTNVIIRTLPSCCFFVRDRKVSNLILVSVVLKISVMLDHIDRKLFVQHR